MTKMSLQSRKELISNVRAKYQQSNWKEKCKIIDGFVAATGYQRKHAIYLLNSLETNKPKKSTSCKGKMQYGLEVKNILLVAWHAANEMNSVFLAMLA